jgi:hypothetical protein
MAVVDALERLFENGLKELLSDYLVRVEMGELYLLKEFIGEGQFQAHEE